MRFEVISFRSADKMLEHAATAILFDEIKYSVLFALGERSINGRGEPFLSRFITCLKRLGWRPQNESEPVFRLLKQRIAIEIEFSRYEFIYRDYFRFLTAYNANEIDVGVLIIKADPKAGRVKHSADAPPLARVKDDFAWLRPTLTVPLWIVALK